MKYVFFPINHLYRVLRSGIVIVVVAALYPSVNTYADEPGKIWKFRIVADDHLSSISDNGINAHVNQLNNLTFLDTTAQGGYKYDPKAVMNGFSLGIGLNTALTKRWSADLDIYYTRKGKTLWFSSVAPTRLTIMLDYIEQSFVFNYAPPIFHNLTLKAGTYFGIPTREAEEYSVTYDKQGMRATAVSLRNLDIWLGGIDCGYSAGFGITLGRGETSTAISLCYKAGLTDLRGTHRSNNTLFPFPVTNTVLSLSLAYMIRIFE